MKFRVKKFKRITIALLVFCGLYVVYMVYKLDTTAVVSAVFFGTNRDQLTPKTVYWNQPYWIIDDGMDGDYQVPPEDVVVGGDGEVNDGEESDGPHVYPYKGIKSEILSIRRTVRDTRPLECKLLTYSYELMPVSIIIVLHNEYIGVILRSLYSIVTNTPKELVREIIYVDDASSTSAYYDDDEFEMYINKTRTVIQNIRILRLNTRLGANRAILAGIKNSTSDHVVLMSQVLDVNRNWLPALLNPMLKNPQTVTVPVHEFRYWKHNATAILDERGLFDLELKYKEFPKLKDVSDATNFRTPVMPPRGMFVVNKNFLDKIHPDQPIGGQDGNLLELSLKIWTCGGRITKVPCSRVSHNFRESGIHDSFIYNKDALNHELKGIIETWFGEEYKEIFLNISSSRFGNITTSTSMQKQQQVACKTFKWYLSKVAPDLKTNFLTKPKVLRTARIQSVGRHQRDAKLCLKQKSKTADFLSLDDCSRATNFDMTRRSDVRQDGTFFCWEAYNEINYRNVSARFVAAQPCSLVLRNQKFAYVEADEHIHHIDTDLCLEAIDDSRFVWLVECDPDKDAQKWILT